MPHDCKGRLIEVGDMVKGKGYNVKHEIIGPVVSVSPGTSCNISVAYPVMHKVGHNIGITGAGVLYRTHSGGEFGLGLAQVGLEYGQTDAFEIIAKHDGSPVPEAKDTQPAPA